MSWLIVYAKKRQDLVGKKQHNNLKLKIFKNLSIPARQFISWHIRWSVSQIKDIQIYVTQENINSEKLQPGDFWPFHLLSGWLLLCVCGS